MEKVLRLMKVCGPCRDNARWQGTGRYRSIVMSASVCRDVHRGVTMMDSQGFRGTTSRRGQEATQIADRGLTFKT